MIDIKEEEESKKIKKFVLKIVGTIVGTIMKLTGNPVTGAIGGAVSSYFGGSTIPLTLTSEPEEKDFTFSICGKTYAAKPDELNQFCTKFGVDLMSQYSSLNEQLSKHVDPSLIESLPINFEPRDYSKFLSELDKKDQ